MSLVFSDITYQDVTHGLGKFGPIESPQFFRGRGDFPYGYVQFHDSKDAARAIEAAGEGGEGILPEKKLLLEPYVPKEVSALVTVGSELLTRFFIQERFTNVYFRNLSPEVTQKQLKEMFIEAGLGKVLSGVLQTDTKGNSRGFGFVNFENNACAKNAINALCGKVQSNGKELVVERARSKIERDANWRRSEQAKKEEAKGYSLDEVYVDKLGPTVGEEKLREEFKRFGKIIRIKIVRDFRTGQSRGFAFIKYSCHDEAAKAIKGMRGQAIDSRTIGVDRAYMPQSRRTDIRSRSWEKPTRIRRK